MFDHIWEQWRDERIMSFLLTWSTTAAPDQTHRHEEQMEGYNCLTKIVRGTDNSDKLAFYISKVEWHLEKSQFANFSIKKNQN